MTQRTLQDQLLGHIHAQRWPDALELAAAQLDDPQIDRGATLILMGKLATFAGAYSTALTHFEQAEARTTADDWSGLAAATRATYPDVATQAFKRAAEHKSTTINQVLAYASWLDGAAPEKTFVTLFNRARSLASDDISPGEIAFLQLASVGHHPTAIGDATIDAAIDAWPSVEAATRAAALATLATRKREAADQLIDRLTEQLTPSSEASLRARVAWVAGAHIEALAHARRGVEMDPTALDSQHTYAELLLLSGELERARPIVTALEASDSATVSLSLSLADAERQAGHNRTSVARLERLLVRHPTLPNVQIATALALADIGRDQDAMPLLEAALKSDHALQADADRIESFLRAATRDVPSAVHATTGMQNFNLMRVRMGHNALLFQVRNPTQTLFIKAFFPDARDRTHVEETAALEAQLSKVSTLTVPTTLKTRDGRHALPVGGGWAQIGVGVDGVSLRRSIADPRQHIVPEQARQIGEALGQLHTTLDQVEWSRSGQTVAGMGNGLRAFLHWPNTPDGWRHDLDDLSMMCTADTLAALDAHFARLAPRLKRHIPDLEAGIIHGDYGWHNLLWRRSKICGVVDFDYAADDFRVADLCNAIHRTAFDWARLERGSDPAARAEIASAILEGYRDTGRPMPSLDALDASFWGVRWMYYLSMTESAISARGSRRYGRPARILELMRQQFDWLAANGGLRRLLRQTGFRTG